MEEAWFAELDDDPASATRAIRSGSAETPRDWPALAVESGFAPDESGYYELLHEATVAAAREAVSERERADDQQLVHAVRAMDDLTEVKNELAERAAEWAGSQFGESREGLDYVLEVAARDPEGPVEAEVVAFAESVRDLEQRGQALRSFVETQAPAVAPNLSNLAEPFLAARLIALAGGLETLAKKPSGTVQVLGAEDALFAHLEGHAPSPKHGIIFTHEYVRGTRPEKRGSAARALAGKLSIAARIDHYRGELHPELRADLEERIATIRAGGAAQ
ncbi:NOP5/NOP56 family protein [Halodesulfurarchaeum sp. HSR-GB]|uniref:NOP5/NOP56 family protein n=1 Tax=Halodesulfurarchaeum sp. HSR-GB TaxID=3074077 RepID=UPI00285EB6B3|nr:NOP5/NOP56 family protein [Halodesulfurarchaeum sp. HSR-GB]MDR5655601.1 NOP5/NOP56 family protein [Halodesulfurarchaeum sp. HSR-GB]